MKLASYRLNNKNSYGVVVGDGIVDLGKRLPYADLRALLEADGLSKAADAAKEKADVKLSDVTFLPLIANPGKIICVGLNYKAHREETGRKPTDNPALFVRFPDSQAAHQEAMVKPKNSEQFDYEGELAVIIGKTGRHVSEKDHDSIIAGYSCYNDGSVRDWQYHTMQWTPGKNYPKTGAFGPWMVTKDEIPDVNKLTLKTRLNGQQVQETGIDLMLFPIPTLIAYITTFTQLNPGDVISTGTPGGVGVKRDPQLFMKAGDKVEVEISSIGILENKIVAE
ncbi:MAG TPA: fumarylacetoacetate hydrolase family protein [Alphaproteobacteria bacterium]|jgi:2-keto-4-pentenoate hydratase/2-oxohepta-3-ene-1,7-dioic acid hydratase in catechol pathway